MSYDMQICYLLVPYAQRFTVLISSCEANGNLNSAFFILLFLIFRVTTASGLCCPSFCRRRT